MGKRLPDLPGLFSTIDSARTIMALSSRDWSTANDSAWLWGLFLGWGPDNEESEDTEGHWRELADRHGWDSATLDRLRTLHGAVRTLTVNSIGDLMALLGDLVDADPCWFDRHGYCQAHGWTQTEPRCPHARAKEFLHQSDGEVVADG